MKHALYATLLAGIASAPLVSGAMAQDKDKVFFILPNSTTIRFESIDAPAFTAAMAALEPNVEVIVQNGDGDPTRQQRLVEDAVSQGAKVIVFTSADSNQVAGALNAAAQGNVPVVLYDHDANGGPAAAHVLHDFLSVGQEQGKRAAELIQAMDKTPVRVARVRGQQGMYGTIRFGEGQDESLQPLIDSGKVEIVCDQFVQGWDPAVAQTFTEDCLTRTGGQVDLILAMNDGTASGAIAALVSQGFKPGDILVAGGQDSTVEGLRYIIQGWQDDTVLKDLKLLAGDAAKVVAAILDGKDLPKDLLNGTVNNQFMDVPAAFLPVSIVTKDNIADVVNSGLWTWAQICQGIEDTDICKANLP